MLDQHVIIRPICITACPSTYVYVRDFIESAFCFRLSSKIV